MKPTQSDPSEDGTDDAIAEYLRRIDSGEEIDREAYVANHEAAAQELRSFFENENLFRNLLANGPTESLLNRPPRSDGRALSAAIIGSRSLPWTKLPADFGRYRVEKLVGRGAMGTVYRAHDTQLDRVVAIKLPHPASDGKPADRQRMIQEARSAASLVHPNICRIYDVGTIDGSDYIAMEFIEGRSLSSYIHGGQLPTLKSVAMTIRKLASALALAHQHGVIHRDVKPANVLIRKNGEPVLMDFGLAQRPLLEGQQRLTLPGTLVGSPAYMAPEQARADHNATGPQTDIYGLGVVLFELTTGRLPFDGSAVTILAKVLSTDPPPLSLLRPDAGPELSGICKRMLAKRAAERFPSMSEVEHAIAAWQKSLTQKATTEPRTADQTPDKQLPQYSDKEITSLAATARKCIRRHDYEMATELLRPIPYSRHSEESLKVLEDASALEQEVRLLTHDMDVALAERKFEDVPFVLKRLLKLKPGHSRAKQLLARLETYGDGRNVRYKVTTDGDLLPARSQDGPLHGFGRVLAGGALIIAGLFLSVLWLTWSQLGDQRRTVVVEADVPGVIVSIGDESVQLHGQLGEIRLLPGAYHYTALLNGSRVAEGQFEVTKDHANRLHVPASVMHPAPDEPVGSSESPTMPAAAEESQIAVAVVDTNAAARSTASEAPGSVSQPAGPETTQGSAPAIYAVDELNSDGDEHSLWISPDALRVYWELEGTIWQAERISVTAPFTNRQRLFQGRHATLDAAETTIIAVVDDVLCQSTRTQRNQTFPPLKPIPALSRLQRAKVPYCTADGKTLVFNHQVSNRGAQVGISRRASPAKPWSPPVQLVVELESPSARLSWPRLMNHEQCLLVNDESLESDFRFVLAPRAGSPTRFRMAQRLAAPGLRGFVGRSPQYVPATDEFWFLSPKERVVRRDSQGAALVDWDIFRLTNASVVLGSSTTAQLTDVIPSSP